MGLFLFEVLGENLNLSNVVGIRNVFGDVGYDGDKYVFFFVERFWI